MNHIWLTWKPDDIQTEQLQAEEEGRDLSSVKNEFEILSKKEADQSPDFQQRVNDLLDTVQQLPTRADYPYVEPSDLESIRAVRPDVERSKPISLPDERAQEKIHGAFLGRCIGCLLGKPIEGYRTDLLWPLLKDAGHAMLTDYIWKLGITKEILFARQPKALWRFDPYDHMPEDDDINYTVTGMAIIKNKGMSFTPEDVAELWLQQIPILSTCTAERVAYRNFINQVAPPQSAILRNPYREWIGAQIRADAFGYIALGRPELAAEMAWRDASISHVKNGIYGEMWVAAMLATAAIEDDVHRIIEGGLAEIPESCRLAEDIRRVMAWYRDGLAYEDAVARIHEQWDEHSQHAWCHTNSNAQIVAMALLWSEGDFETAITRAVWPCFDTDCNGATVGSIMGMIQGAKTLPGKWVDPLNDTVVTGVAGYNRTTISAIANETFKLYQRKK